VFLLLSGLFFVPIGTWMAGLVLGAVLAAVAVAAAGVWCLGFRSRSVHAESERILRLHLEQSLDLICTASFNGHFVQLSPSWRSTLGYELDELRTRPFTDFIHPDDLERTLAEVDKQARSGQLVFNFQNRYRHADGSYRWLEWTSRPDYEAGLMFAVARDVTQRKQAEEIVARHQEILEQTVAERTAELEQARWETLRCLALAAEYRDDQTYEHTQRVGRTSAAIAHELGLDAHFVELIRHAAPLHDVGKLGIPDAILLKPGFLTDAEFELVREHAAAGARILGESSSELLQLAEEIALSHHEWWDGSGYPRGLAGDDIPLAGRIVAVADVYDALTHERPYKPAWTVTESVREMRRLTGRQFDATLMDAFHQLDPDALAGHKEQPATVALRAVGYS
jgi:PAS domain S-box-containing protein